MGEAIHDGPDDQLTVEDLFKELEPEKPARYPAGLLHMALPEVRLVGPTLDTSRPVEGLVEETYLREEVAE